MLKWIVAGGVVWWAMPRRKKRKIKRVVRQARQAAQKLLPA